MPQQAVTASINHFKLLESTYVGMEVSIEDRIPTVPQVCEWHQVLMKDTNIEQVGKLRQSGVHSSDGHVYPNHQVVEVHLWKLLHYAKAIARSIDALDESASGFENTRMVQIFALAAFVHSSMETVACAAC
jgi:hypothetical protein